MLRSAHLNAIALPMQSQSGLTCTKIATELCFLRWSIIFCINKPLSVIAKKKIGTKTFVNKKPLKKPKKIDKLEKRLYVQAKKDKIQKEEQELEKKIKKYSEKLEKKKMKKQRISAEFKKLKKSVSILIKKDNDE